SFDHNYGVNGWQAGYALTIIAHGTDANGNTITREVPHVDLSVQPSAPSNFTADYGSGGTSASLSWANTSTIATGYKVQRQSPFSNWQTIATLAPSATSYTDNTAVPGPFGSGGGYVYRVVPTNYTNSGGANPNLDPQATTTVAPTEPSPTFDSGN